MTTLYWLRFAFLALLLVTAAVLVYVHLREAPGIPTDDAAAGNGRALFSKQLPKQLPKQ